MSNVLSYTLVGGCALALSACSMTETTTSVKVHAGPPLERVRLLRPEATPLTAAWRQDGATLVGRLSFAEACGTEVVQVNRRTKVTDTHHNRRYTTAAYVAGGFLTLAGVALIANSQSKSEVVTCGDGRTPRSGDSCHSEAGSWRTLGAIVVGSGLGSILGGLIVQSRKPVIETRELPSEEVVRPVADRKACGHTEALEGAVIEASLSSGGTWRGTANRNGEVLIELTGAALTRGARASMTLESMTSDAGLALTKRSLGDLELVPLSARSRP